MLIISTWHTLSDFLTCWQLNWLFPELIFTFSGTDSLSPITLGLSSVGQTPNYRSRVGSSPTNCFVPSTSTLTSLHICIHLTFRGARILSI